MQLYNQKAVPVIASFDTCGKIMPLYLRIDGKQCKVESCKIRNSLFNQIEYNCQVSCEGYMRPLLLHFYSAENVWTIPEEKE
jgi:hypothetical protein